MRNHTRIIAIALFVGSVGCEFQMKDGLRGKDPAVERITRNVLDRLSK